MGSLAAIRKKRRLIGLCSGLRLVLVSEDNEGFALIPTKIFERKLDYVNRLCFSADE